jgi:hypothetical protein
MRDLLAASRLHLTIAIVAVTATAVWACEERSPPAEPAHEEGTCEPPVDLERCDGERRLACDAVTKSWILIETCETPAQCAETDLEDEGPAMATECVLERGP